MPDRSQTASRSDRTDGNAPGSRTSDGNRPDDGPDGDESDGDRPDGRELDSDDVAGAAGGSDDDQSNSPESDDREPGSAASGRFRKLDDVEYDRVNDFLRGYVDFTAREWAVARLCADFRTGTGVEMTAVGENLPEMVPFVTDRYTRQEVYQARQAFEDRVRRAAATFLYGANAGFLEAEEVDDVLYEATEVAKLLLEVEGASLGYDEERATEERTIAAMRSVHEASLAVRYDECPHCGEQLDADST